MHCCILVVGESINDQLHPFADHTKVEPYRVFVEGEDLTAMAEHFGISPDNLPALAEKMPEWDKVEGEVYQNRLCFWSRENPNGKFDWYEVGGRFSGYILLNEPRAPSFFGKLFGRKPTDRVNNALKRDVVVESILEDPPAAILSDDTWIEQRLDESAPSDEQWKQQFAEFFMSIPDDQMLTVVDIHS